MYTKLFDSPLRFSRATAERILNRLFLRYNALEVQEKGDILVRFMHAMTTFFSRMRRSLMSDQHLVSRLEGPSSTKFNDLMESMVGDIDNTFVQQNAIDNSIVETHNFLDEQRADIEKSLKTASERLTDLFAITSIVDSGVITFVDSFDTKGKHDDTFPTALEQADVDVMAGVIRLASGSRNIPVDIIKDRQIQVFFDGQLVESNNTFSWGKLYGDPRDLGENGIRAIFEPIVIPEETIAQGENRDSGTPDIQLEGRPNPDYTDSI